MGNSKSFEDCRGFMKQDQNKTKIKITALKKEDKKFAKHMEKVLEHEFDKFEGIISAMTSARVYIDTAYPFVKLPDSIWDRILEEAVRMEIKRIENEPI